jgi:hypothetical protein
MNGNNQSSLIQVDFKTARGQGIQIKKEIIESAKTRVVAAEDLDHIPTFSQIPPAPTPTLPLKPIDGNKQVVFSDFKTSSGKPLTMIKELVDLEAEKLLKINGGSDMELSSTSNNTTLSNNSTPSDSKDDQVTPKVAHVALTTLQQAPKPPLRDGKPFKKPQFVAKKVETTKVNPVVVELAQKPNSEINNKTTSDEEDESLLNMLPLTDLFDLPVQTPTQDRSKKAKFSNFHMFSAQALAKTSLLKISDIRIETVSHGFVARPILDLIPIDSS